MAGARATLTTHAPCTLEAVAKGTARGSGRVTGSCTGSWRVAGGVVSGVAGGGRRVQAVGWTRRDGMQHVIAWARTVAKVSRSLVGAC